MSVALATKIHDDCFIEVFSMHYNKKTPIIDSLLLCFIISCFSSNVFTLFVDDLLAIWTSLVSGKMSNVNEIKVVVVVVVVFLQHSDRKDIQPVLVFC